MSSLNVFNDGDEVNTAILYERNIINNKYLPVKFSATATSRKTSIKLIALQPPLVLKSGAKVH